MLTLHGKVWIHEITNDDIGEEIYYKYKEQHSLEKIYNTVKNKYDIMYKELNIEKNMKVNKGISIGLGISILINIVTFVFLFVTR